MIAEAFDHVRHWVFDLDNTLYHPEVRLFDQIELKMTDWVMAVSGVGRAQANHLRQKYWRDHGTTLAGLMAEQNIEPEPFLTDVHDISFDALTVDPVLRGQIGGLPGRKIVYTNGTAPYALNVLKARGLDDAFDAIYGVEHAGFRPKPEAAAFDAVFSADGVDHAKGAMFEDEARNLEVPHALGLRTVHVAAEPDGAHYVHHHTDDLSGFLAQLGH